MRLIRFRRRGSFAGLDLFLFAPGVEAEAAWSRDGDGGIETGYGVNLSVSPLLYGFVFLTFDGVGVVYLFARFACSAVTS